MERGLSPLDSAWKFTQSDQHTERTLGWNIQLSSLRARHQEAIKPICAEHWQRLLLWLEASMRMNFLEGLHIWCVDGISHEHHHRHQHCRLDLAGRASGRIHVCIVSLLPVRTGIGVKAQIPSGVDRPARQSHWTRAWYLHVVDINDELLPARDSPEEAFWCSKPGGAGTSAVNLQSMHSVINAGFQAHCNFVCVRGRGAGDAEDPLDVLTVSFNIGRCEAKCLVESFSIQHCQRNKEESQEAVLALWASAAWRLPRDT